MVIIENKIIIPNLIHIFYYNNNLFDKVLQLYDSITKSK